MSLYLGYVLERAGAPLPRNIVVLQYDNGWANRQIKYEFESLFPDVQVSVTAQVECEQGTLLILPYMDEFYFERPGGTTLYKDICNFPSSWVMLYGLRYRKIDVMPAPELFRYFTSCLRVSRTLKIMNRFHLIGTIRALLRLSI
jgi:hypothetical protein